MFPFCPILGRAAITKHHGRREGRLCCCRFALELDRCQRGNGNRTQDADREKVETPSGFNFAKANAFDHNDIECDQKDVSHREFAKVRQNRQCFRLEQIEMHQGKADRFQIRRKERERGDEQRKKDIVLPEALQSGNDTNLGQAK